MKSELRILLLEDSALDARLIEQELRNAGLSFSLTMIQTEAELRQQLEPQLPDVVLSDHGLPSFDGFAALDIVREKCPDLPFIFVSGSNDQGMVTEMFDHGATDYVYKNDIRDLPKALDHALTPVEVAPRAPVAPTPQSELELLLPPPSPAQQIFGLPLGHLAFCPKCLQTRDDAGNLVQLESCLSTHSEIVILRQVCKECGRHL